MNFKESQTLKNLTRAFAGECMDGAKYQYLADTAVQKQLSQVSTILKALATNEMAHAKVFYDYICEKGNNEVEIVEVKSTIPMHCGDFNSLFKIESDLEQRQADTVYPAFAKDAEKEGFKDIAKKFMQIAKIESCHSRVLAEVGQMINNGSMYISDYVNLWKCMNCGHEDELKKAWKTCPICSKNQGYWKYPYLLQIVLHSYSPASNR